MSRWGLTPRRAPSSLAYWEGPAGTGQAQLFPAYALTAAYTGTYAGITDMVVVTGTIEEASCRSSHR